METKKKKMSKDVLAFNIMGYIVIGFLAIICILPIWLVIAGSFSSNSAILTTGYGLWFKNFTFDAYRMVFEQPMEMLNAYKVSIIVTVCGTLCILFVCSTAGYALSRPNFAYKRFISFYYFFTTIFGAGLAPTYIYYVNTLHVKQHPYLIMIISGAFSYFYTIIFRNFMAEIPASLGESAQIDGATEIQVFVKIILPLSKPVMATITLFAALGHWGDWFTAMMYVTDKDLYPLQYYLYEVLNRAQALANLSSQGLMTEIVDLPTETYKLAITVVTTGPIVLLYPFIQKYFIKGMTVGAVKG